VSEREATLGRNEAVFREVNERIREITTYRGAERVRRDAAQFLIVPGHDHPDVETVVSANDRFAVVRRKPGVPTEVAVETDPRA
jgi:metallophosphoesterase superfamily enzyme